MRTGVLSDDYIMNNVCVEYRPVPLGKVGNILTPEMKPKHGLELRAAKYVRPPPRPATFQAMSNSLSNQADPTNPLPFQQQLAKQYKQELAHVFPPPLKEIFPEQDSDDAPDSDDDEYPDLTNPFKVAIKQQLKRERSIQEQEAQEEAQEQQDAADIPPLPQPTPTDREPIRMFGNMPSKEAVAEGLKTAGKAVVKGVSVAAPIVAKGVSKTASLGFKATAKTAEALNAFRNKLQQFKPSNEFDLVVSGDKGGSSTDIEAQTPAMRKAATLAAEGAAFNLNPAYSRDNRSSGFGG